MGGSVFINYRRTDSHRYGTLLYVDLVRRFGEDLIFLAAESTPVGEVYGRESPRSLCETGSAPRGAMLRNAELVTVAGFPIGELWWELEVGAAVRFAGPRGARRSREFRAAGDA